MPNAVSINKAVTADKGLRSFKYVLLDDFRLKPMFLICSLFVVEAGQVFLLENYLHHPNL